MKTIAIRLSLLTFRIDLLFSDEQSIALLEEFSRDPEPIVAQSCEVALSMLEYENSGKSFEVNTLI